MVAFAKEQRGRLHLVKENSSAYFTFEFRAVTAFGGATGLVRRRCEQRKSGCELRLPPEIAPRVHRGEAGARRDTFRRHLLAGVPDCRRVQFDALSGRSRATRFDAGGTYRGHVEEFFQIVICHFTRVGPGMSRQSSLDVPQMFRHLNDARTTSTASAEFIGRARASISRNCTCPLGCLSSPISSGDRSAGSIPLSLATRLIEISRACRGGPPEWQGGLCVISSVSSVV